MAIQYSGNAGIFSTTTGASTPAVDAETFLLSSLVTSGWGKTTQHAFDTLTFTSQPGASSTFTLDGSPFAETYTFVSSAPTGNQILIDTSLANTLQNVLNALNSGPGSGTKYGSTLTPPPNMSATVNTTQLKVTYNTGTSGSAGNGAPVSTTGSINGTWATSTLLGGGNLMLTAISPQGLQGGCVISTAAGSFYSPGTALSIVPCNRDQSRQALNSVSPINATNNTAIKIIANKYQFVGFQPGAAASNIFFNPVGVGIPFITSNLQAATVVSATNANPIVITIPSHGFTSGQSVLIVGGVGNTAVNSVNNITVIDANTFSIPVAGNGTYVANSAFASNLTIGNSVAEAIWSMGTGGGAPATFRNVGYESASGWLCVNTGISEGESSSGTPLQLVVNGSVSNPLISALQWSDNTFVIQEPFLAWGINLGANAKIIGQMWDAVVVRAALTIDQTATFDSPPHNWWSVGNGDNSNCLMLATS